MVTLPNGRSQVGLVRLVDIPFESLQQRSPDSLRIEQITKSEAVAQYAKDLFDRDCVAFVDLRSAKHNFFLTRIIRSK